jgi:hypothetical protein
VKIADSCIRVAGLEDLDLLVQLALRYHLAAYMDVLPPTPQSPQWLQRVAAQLIGQGTARFFIADDEGAPSMSGAIIYAHPTSGAFVGYLLVGTSNAQPDVRIALLREAEGWARQSGAVLFQVPGHSADDCTFYQALGFETFETLLQRRLQ